MICFLILFGLVLIVVKIKEMSLNTKIYQLL